MEFIGMILYWLKAHVGVIFMGIAGATTIAYLPIHLAKFKTTLETLQFANMFCTGAL